MPWTTPDLKTVRKLTRDYVTAALGARAIIPNSVLRIMSDAQSGLAHLILLYIDWLSKQFLPDTAEKEWLDRHGVIWLENADGSKGRKSATYAEGSVLLTGQTGFVIAADQILNGIQGVNYQTTEEVTLGTNPVSVPAVCLTAGVIGNLESGDTLAIETPIDGLDSTATVEIMSGGADDETDPELRERVLFRIQEPPMGGDANDYVAWARAFPGVTRAWCSPNEMGAGTVTVRFMMDDTYEDGFATDEDAAALKAYMETKRPVAIREFFVEVPLQEEIDFTITNMEPDDDATKEAVAAKVAAMIAEKGRPASALNGVRVEAQTIYAAWVSEAILSAPGVEHFDLVMVDHEMPDNGYMAVMGDITYA